MSAVAVGTAAELVTLLRDLRAAGGRRRVRFVGRGTRPRLLPPPATDALQVSLAGLAGIERLEPDDLTCSVGAGVTCHELATTLAAKGLELGGLRADDPGTVGGLYAADPLGPGAPGAPCPRTTLLGAEAVLADGTAFRAGARVVKSVAGFDVHRLLVGSRGRLFAATLLHLKLRPAPRARAPFATEALSLDEAVRRWLDLRRAATTPQRLLLRGSRAAGVAVAGTFTGRPDQVTALLRAHQLPPHAAPIADHLPAPTDGELLVGRARATRLLEVLAALPPTAPFVAHAGGHFETVLAAAATDRLLAALPALEASAAIALGARVGGATPLDPGAAMLQHRLERALDPDEVLA